MNPWGGAATPFDAIGGADRVQELASVFYDVIEDDSPVLRAMLPDDTARTRQVFSEFMSGWLGGPPLYMERHGHPQLRMRHARFDIGREEASEWMRCMRLTFDRLELDEGVRSFLDDRLGALALHLVNRSEVS